VHPTASVSASAVIGAGVTVEAHAVIGDDVTLGDGCWIGANAVIGAGSTLGRDVRVFPTAVVYPFVELGDRVMLHAGARIGREGFGFTPTATGVVRIPHVGRCVLEHDVEIGANSCVDRGSVDDTVIGAGTKIDSLVHIAHNVRIGRMCFIIAQVGVAGSTRIEDGVQLGGQVGVAGHVTIGARASIGAQGGVFGDIPAGETWSGYPARPHKEQLRATAALFRLAKIIRPLERLLGERGDA
jgi:UDP-3-O-[3-hydroxymyristoyl] glucosamine N-acyltransferase